jgi:hypothetical protein
VIRKLETKDLKRKTRIAGDRLVLCSFYVFSFAFLLLSAWPASAQDDDLAPPPLRTITKEENAALESTVDVKARTMLALAFMNSHMLAAEDRDAKHDYDAVFHELGGFHGLLDNTLLFLTKGDRNSKKVLDNLKRFEIGLRGFTPRLEVIHRELPFRYEDYVRKLIVYVRNARSKALDPLFSDTVVKQ